MEKQSKKADDFGQWKHNQETERFFEYLKAKERQIQERWSAGAFTLETLEGTGQLNAKMIGKVETIQEILNMDADYDE